MILFVNCAAAARESACSPVSIRTTMRFVRRRLFTIASAISLLLCLATLAIWLRSYSVISALFYHRGRTTIASVVQLGAFELARYRETSPTPRVGLQAFDKARGDVLLGSGGATELDTYLLFRKPQLSLPLWMLSIGEALMPSWWIVRRLKSMHAIRPETCRFCGYNLTANTSGVCPECGTAITAKGNP